MTRTRLFLRFITAAISAITLAGALSCSDDPTGPAPEPASVTVESTSRVQATIGPAGGTLSTTSNTGTSYVLNIPPGALPGEVKITLAPVTSIRGLPYAGGIEGAVQLQPSGLNLLVPATLTIGTTATPTGAQRLVGFQYQGDAASFELAAGGQTGGEIRVMVSHFSGAGAALADPANLSDCEALGPGEPLSIVITSCVEAGDRTAFLDLMQRYFDDVVLPAVQNGTGDSFQDGVRAYLQWRTLVDGGLAGVYGAADAATVFADRILSIEETIDTKIQDGIAAEKARCTPGDLQWLIEVFEYRALAVAVFEGLPPGLDDLIFANLCASAIVESTELADPLPLNQDRSLDIDFAIDINGTPTDAAFAVTVSDPDNLVRTPAGRTDAQGRYTTVVRRLIDEGANFDIAATLILPLFGASGLALTEVPITVEDQVFRGGNARITTNLAATVSTAPFTLNLLVERLLQSGYAPVDGAQVTLSVQGGTANPAQVTTDPAGITETQITPSASAQALVIDIAVVLDGVSLGSKRVEAAIVAGGIVLRTNTHSMVSTDSYRDYGGCTGSGKPFEYVEHFGHVSIAAQSEEHCVDPLTQNTTRSSFASLIADPGVAADGQSAAMTFQASGMAYASVDTCVDAFFCKNILSSARLNFHVEFDVVGASMNFELDATHGWDAPSPSSARIILTRQSGTNPQIINWNGTPTDLLLVGNLTPGHYVFEYGANVVVTAEPNGGPRTATWNTEGTLTITPAPAAMANEGDR